MATLLILAACGGAEEQSAPVPSSLTAVSGAGQSGPVGALLNDALVVEVRDSDGQPISGFTVAWTVASGGGVVGSATTTTGGDGRASNNWTLGGTLGPQAVSATAAAGLSATFSATGTAAPASQIAVAGETSFSALQATSQLTAQLQDSFGNPVSGEVAWSTSDVAVATVSDAGLVTAMSNGTAVITAASGELTGSAQISVAQVAATLSITPTAPIATVGATVQLTASGLDANGFEVGVTGATFSSTSNSVATVSESGLVTAVASGTTLITATAGAATGSVTMTVTDAPFEPNGDMTVDGDLAAERITIPPGVTVTLTAGATLSSATTLTVGGTIVGDCVPATLSAGTDLTITGSITTTCSDTTRVGEDLVLTAAGDISTTNASLTSGGAVAISNLAIAGAPQGVSALASSRRVGGCHHTNLEMKSGFGRFHPDGTQGKPGGQISVLCGGEMVIEGGEFIPGDGAKGPTSRTSGQEPAVGGTGGAGGLLRIVASGITFRRLEQLPEGQTERSVRIMLGQGGTGGDAIATGELPTAIGGIGGDSQLPIIEATTGGIVLVGGVGSPAISLVRSSHPLPNVGGRGGTAFATGDDGADATSDTPAQEGRRASATGGKGGRLGGDKARVDLLGDVFVGGVTNPGALSIVGLDGATPGPGGSALATGGNGGAGSAEFKDGANGGPSIHMGGEAGELNFFDNRSNQYIGVGADGGRMGLGSGISGERVFGSGGSGFGSCGIGGIGPGGRGGNGGLAGGESGFPSLVNGARQGERGGLVILAWGNGGDGGDGAGPGAGGGIGDFSASTFRAPATHLGSLPRLIPGAVGNDCGIIVEPAISVTSDLNGHAPFIGLAGVSQLSVTPGADGALTISGNGPWILLTGTVAADGSFTLSGSGTVAGNPGVGITMTGVLTLDAERRVVGITSGTLTVDADNSVLPPNGSGQRNPAIYSVTGAKVGGQ